MAHSLPVIEIVHGESDGPTISILGGVHGDEFEGVLANRQIRNILEKSLRRGTVKFAAPAHPAAWKASTRASPIDGSRKCRRCIV